MRQSVGWLDLI